MSVACGHKKGCKGAIHDPACPKYIDALEDWAPTIMDKKRKNRSGPRRPEDRPLMSDEQRAEIARENGKKGGRPPGSGYPIPLTAIQILKKGKFRVKKEYQGEDEISRAAQELAGFALERMALAAGGRVHSRKAPTVLKASDALRHEICEPVEAVTTVKTMDLGKALDEVEQRKLAALQKEIEEKK